MMYKIVNGMAPPYLIDMFSKKCSTSSYFMRGSALDLKLPRARSDLYKRGFAFTGVKLWNSLPIQTKEQKSLSAFTRALDLLNVSAAPE